MIVFRLTVSGSSLRVHLHGTSVDLTISQHGRLTLVLTLITGIKVIWGHNKKIIKQNYVLTFTYCIQNPVFLRRKSPTILLAQWSHSECTAHDPTRVDNTLPPRTANRGLQLFFGLRDKVAKSILGFEEHGHRLARVDDSARCKSKLNGYVKELPCHRLFLDVNLSADPSTPENACNR